MTPSRAEVSAIRSRIAFAFPVSFFESPVFGSMALWSGLVLAGVSGAAVAQPPDGPPPPPPVNAEPVRMMKANSSYRLLGTVMPQRSATIGCAVPGRVASLLATRGDRLAAGDPIAQLRTEVIEIELEAARAELRLFQQQLNELQAGSRPEDIAEAKARMEAAEAISKRAASQLRRIERLVSSRAASQDEVDVATAEADSSQRLYDAAVINHERLVAGPRAEQVAQAQARVDLQREQVKLLEDRLNKHTVVAPFDGYVTTEHTESGAWLSAGAPVVDLIELDTVEVEVAVPASQVVSLEPGQTIRVECPERPTALLLGKLDRIVPSADTRARTFPVLVEIENQIENGIPTLLAGMVVRIDLPAGPESEAMFVPTDAIVLNKTGQSLFVVDVEEDGRSGTVREVPVTLGIADGDRIAVEGDLGPGELVVTRGNERLRAGQKVTVTIEDS